jgi:hypothetical protein
VDLVLVHGMGRTPVSMARLGRRLRRAGHNPLLFAYSPTFETLQGASARLVRLIERRIRGTYALVGHSLGTVIIRASLPRLHDRPPAACFFLAAPMTACKAARHFSRYRLYRWATGEMGQLLASDAFMRQLPMPAALTRLYAGVGGPRAAWLPHGTEANDGILSVPEATGRFRNEAVLVPAIHTFIMNAKQVYDELIASLATLEASARSGDAPPQENTCRHPPS